MRMGTETSKDAAPKIESIQGILEEVLGVSPDIISMQEVVPEMYGVLHHQLTHLHWKVYRRRIHENQKHFVVTAVREQAEESTDHTTTHAWPNSKDGRHTLTVRRRGCAVTNVNCESGYERLDRDVREEQIRYLSRSHEQHPTGVQETGVMAGNWNMRQGEDSLLLQDHWRDVWTAYHGRADKDLIDGWTYSRGVVRASG